MAYCPHSSSVLRHSPYDWCSVVALSLEPGFVFKFNHNYKQMVLQSKTSQEAPGNRCPVTYSWPGQGSYCCSSRPLQLALSGDKAELSLAALTDRQTTRAALEQLSTPAQEAATSTSF